MFNLKIYLTFIFYKIDSLNKVIKKFMKGEIKTKIDQLFEGISTSGFTIQKESKAFIEKIINMIDSGELRAAEKINGKWEVNDFVKKAILIYMKYNKAHKISVSIDNYFKDDLTSIYFSEKNIGRRLSSTEPSYGFKYFDKVPLKFAHFTDKDFANLGSRFVPGSIIRIGTFIGKKCVIMPSFINIGAYIGDGTMIDTWSTIGSCAQIGKKCHISGGVGIGGVLEPANAMPVIIEDNVFIGARSEIAEGVIVEEGSVISMGVYIGASTKIINRETGEVLYGRVPAGSVVVPGTTPSKNGVNLYAAIIVKTVDTQTKSKTAITELLREL